MKPLNEQWEIMLEKTCLKNCSKLKYTGVRDVYCKGFVKKINASPIKNNSLIF